MLKVVEKALEKDMINNVLKYNHETNTAEYGGLCIYLLIVSCSIDADCSEQEINELECYIQLTGFYRWLKIKYDMNRSYMYPLCQNWKERLEVLKLYKAHIESLIKKM